MLKDKNKKIENTQVEEKQDKPKVKVKKKDRKDVLFYFNYKK